MQLIKSVPLSAAGSQDRSYAGWGWGAGFKQEKGSSWTFQEESPESESLFGEKVRDQLPYLSACLSVSKVR